MMLFITLFLAAFGGPLVVTQADLEHTVELYVRARYANTAREMTVEFRSVPDGLAVSGSAYTLRVSALATPLPLGNVSFPVEVISDGHVVNQCIVSAKVRTFDSVLVTARQLGQHERITSEDVRREKIETTGLRGTALTKCRSTCRSAYEAHHQRRKCSHGGSYAGSSGNCPGRVRDADCEGKELQILGGCGGKGGWSAW